MTPVTANHPGRMNPAHRIAASAILVLLAIAGIACVREGATPDAASTRAATYTCPMHPAYTSDRPGSCPICGMDLVRVPDAGQAHGTPATSVRLHGRSELLGIRWAVVERRAASALLRLPGRVAIDDRSFTHVHARVEGFVEHVFVEVLGTSVVAGQPLLEMSSPEIIASEQEYLAALASVRSFPADAPAWAVADARALADAARRRLELWEVTPGEIRDIERSGKPRRVVTLRAPTSGIVTMREAYHHSRAVTPDLELYTIVDFSRVFVFAQASEQDVPRLVVGQPAEILVPGAAGPQRIAPIAFVSPSVDDATRTVSVRLDVDNGDGRLRPGGVVDVVIHEDLGENLIVPEGAVIDSGSAQHVFVEGPDGEPIPWEVVAGPLVAGGRVILEGLDEGERVVASAGYLIDSESRLAGALDAMTAPMPANMPGMEHGDSGP